MANGKKIKLTYIGTETNINELLEYVKDEGSEDIIFSPLHINDNGQAELVLYVNEHILPKFCTSLGIYAASCLDATFTDLDDVIPVYGGVVDSDVGHNEF